MRNRFPCCYHYCTGFLCKKVDEVRIYPVKRTHRKLPGLRFAVRRATTPQFSRVGRHNLAIVMTNNWIQIKLYPQCVTAQLARTETVWVELSFSWNLFCVSVCSCDGGQQGRETDRQVVHQSRQIPMRIHRHTTAAVAVGKAIDYGEQRVVRICDFLRSPLKLNHQYVEVAAAGGGFREICWIVKRFCLTATTKGVIKLGILSNSATKYVDVESVADSFEYCY